MQCHELKLFLLSSSILAEENSAQGLYTIAVELFRRTCLSGELGGEPGPLSFYTAQHVTIQALPELGLDMVRFQFCKLEPGTRMVGTGPTTGRVFPVRTYRNLEYITLPRDSLFWLDKLLIHSFLLTYPVSEWAM
jgi:hypothetical protein